MSEKRIQLPAIQIPVFGIKDQSHIIRHSNKMQVCPLDAGVDLFPSSIKSVNEYSGWYEVRIATLFTMVFQPGSYGWITDRSSTAKVTAGATVLPGIIDAGYTGEIIIRLQVIMPRPYENFEDSLHPVAVALKDCIANQTAIAQIIPTQSLAAAMVVVDPNRLPNYGRNTKGFGSTNGLGK